MQTLSESRIPHLQHDAPLPRVSNGQSHHSDIDTAHAPGHWVFARLGKKVLRPGGLAATRTLLSRMNITSSDNVVEFAPGIGITAEMILARKPASYTAVERDLPAAQRLRSIIGSRGHIYDGSAQSSGLSTGQASRVIGEAMLSMHPVKIKSDIMAEAARILQPGGLYGIHELALRPANAAPEVRRDLCRAMSKAIHHGVTPISTAEWLALLNENGFDPVSVEYVPFRLLTPSRLIADEGLIGALRFLKNLVLDKQGRKRVLEMRKVFQKHSDNLSAIVIIARKNLPE